MSIHSNLRAMWLLVVALIANGACSGGNNREMFSKMQSLAEKGNPEAQYHLGMMLNNGIGIKKNPQEAFQWFSKSAESGDPLGAYKLGCYYAGQFEGVVPVDEEKVMRWKLVAANAGYSLAQCDIGNLSFKHGNVAEAIRWWELAGNQGYTQALYNLSVVYKEGKGVSKSNARAYAYFKLSKLAGEGTVNQQTQATLDEFQKSMSQSEMKEAENFVASWRPQVSPLTQKASSGISEARKVVQGAAG